MEEVLSANSSPKEVLLVLRGDGGICGRFFVILPPSV